MSTSNLSDAFAGLIADYYPAISEITDTDITTERTAVVSWLSAEFQEHEMAPASAFGDLFVAPAATNQAGLRTALKRFLGDLDLSNIAAGGAYNCAIANAFVTNFEPRETEQRYARGTLQATFSVDADVLISADTTFVIGSNTYELDNAVVGDLVIRKAGSILSATTNQVRLTQTGSNSFTTGITVRSKATGSIAAGDTASVVRYSIANLTGLVAAHDFVNAANPTTLMERASSARKMFISAACNTRVGIQNSVKQAFPELNIVTAVIPNDRDSTRTGALLIGGGDAPVDVFVRSPAYGHTVTQTIVFKMDVGTNSLIAALDTLYAPILIESFVSGELEWAPGNSATVVTQSISSGASLCTASGTEHQRLYALLSMRGVTALAADTTTADGLPGYSVTMAYRYEPLLPQVAQVSRNSGKRPVGLDLLVRPVIPAVVNRFTVIYRAKSGMRINSDQALKEIIQHLRACGGSAPFSYARICEIMVYANAQDVLDVSCDIQVAFSPATKVLPAAAATPLVAPTLPDAISIPAFAFSNGNSLATFGEFRDPMFGTPTETLVSANRSNIAFVFDDSVVTLREVS